MVIEGNVRRGKLHVAPSPAVEPPEASVFSGGDRSVVALARNGGYAAVVTDDSSLLERLKALGVSATVPAALLVAAGRRRRLPAQKVMSLLESLRPYVSSEEFVTYRLILEGRYPKK